MATNASRWLGRLRRSYHVARADILQRFRTRRLLVVLAVMLYAGYLVNVGSIELFYTTGDAAASTYVTGEPTAPYVGLTAGLTGGMIFLFGGHTVLSGGVGRDRSSNVDLLIASSPTGDVDYLVGKWLSNLGVVTVLLAGLGGAALVNHAIHGTGATDPVWILGMVFLIGFPTGALAGAVTLLLQSSSRLNGTLGTVVYFFAAIVGLLLILPTFEGGQPTDLSFSLRALDVSGFLTSHTLLYETLAETLPGYDGGPPSFGQGYAAGETGTFSFTGDAIPPWVYLNRAVLIGLGGATVLAATFPYDQFERAQEGQSIGQRLVSSMTGVLDRGADVPSNPTSTPDADSLTPVTDRDASGFPRLLRQELRLLLRGQPLWWYVGALVIIVAGVSGQPPRPGIVTVAAIWPLFVWSSMGSRPIKGQLLPLLVSSQSVRIQPLAEWLAGVLVGTVFFGAALLPAAGTAPVGEVLVIAGAAIFAPSVAQALGAWTGSTRPFELGYLVIWYAGPLNAVTAVDFAGATGTTTGTAVPFVFGAIGFVALAGTLARRHTRV
ncbi:hypothetical protein SAMN05444422_109200 [Halobiforma haloterrestris]|uniref:ABC-2 family transporter protein n=1 Tax=Natronobacterium haloterrestre TaxID=148448 RepID=A0A1I1JTV7_NATHA|nr:hypothetical protein [Halobiforma haloterrestris]SFC51946.1 hypothetical protein SAMN05444422_109200 [Halobiforma haloterrestris]